MRCHNKAVSTGMGWHESMDTFKDGVSKKSTMLKVEVSQKSRWLMFYLVP